MKYIFTCLFLFFMPTSLHAAIIINEVAWMGNSISANDEWIELYNTGSESVSVDGWMLRDEMNLEIALSGVVGTGQYAVLERTDDASAVGTAFLIYTGALSNSGATLSLYRSDGSLEDRVAGGDAWQNIGGDNVTKETAQYTNVGWITAAATPGALNAFKDSGGQNIDTTQDDSSNSQDDTSGLNSGVSNTTTLYTTPRELLLSLHIPKHAYVNQSVPMNIEASGLAKGILQSMHYIWNLGDFATTTGQSITARYKYPGEYVVTVHGTYKTYSADVRQTITVLPVNFSITLSPTGEVQVHNDARYEVDVSGYYLVSDSILVFPPGTILLPNATITIPKDKLQYHTQVVLLDAVGTEVSRFVTEPIIENIDTQRTTRTVSLIHNDTTNKDIATGPDSNTPFKFLSQETIGSVLDTQQFSASATVAQEEIVSSPSIARESSTSDVHPIPIQNPKLPYFLLLGVIAIGIFGVFVGRAR